ncbi:MULTISPECIES: hypothetical protein [unclassified Vibrio]|uniref:hypothetical protein n=1 Tax=unclassified Vibrio TaxID=2614977 RepID=UPI0028079E27|nr:MULTISPECIES: hypothetical protein [unclassified Vibrio]ELA7191271.1 hypothetical protein [Vibrio alginolyticus]MDW1675169.1 hypothetical protein [Vibrio sp. Vb2610]MDW1807328.1 hypothetical protein [Vibrio sp. Vb2628]
MSQQDVFEESSLILDEKTYTTTFKVFQSDTCQKTYLSENSVLEEIYYNQLETQKKWNELLLKRSVFIDETNTCESLTEKLQAAFKCMYSPTISDSLLRSIQHAINTYEEDQHEASKNRFSDCSVNSLKQFVRYIPNFNTLYHKVYIDKDSGFFGIVLKSSKKSKPMLNLLLQDNGEVTFSFIERKKGMIKISGRAHFNHNLEDSTQIKHLLRMVRL